MKYNRVVIKLSGEALSSNNNIGIDKDILLDTCNKIKKLKESGVKVAVIVGGGNFYRGRSNKYLDEITTNNIGMLATVMNALAIENTLKNIGCSCKAFSAIEINKMIDFANMKKAKEEYEDNVLIFGGGIGNPCFSTDMCAVLRAVELEADLIIKLSKVDGIYTRDPLVDKSAKKYDKISYDEVISKELSIMDLESILLAKKYRIPIIVNKLEGSSFENIINKLEGSIIE